MSRVWSKRILTYFNPNFFYFYILTSMKQKSFTVLILLEPSSLWNSTWTAFQCLSIALHMPGQFPPKCITQKSPCCVQICSSSAQVVLWRRFCLLFAALDKWAKSAGHTTKTDFLLCAELWNIISLEPNTDLHKKRSSHGWLHLLVFFLSYSHYFVIFRFCAHLFFYSCFYLFLLRILRCNIE